MIAVEWGDATRVRLTELAPRAVAVMPVGAIEQHGPHLPTRTDTAIVTEVARRAIAQLDGDVSAVLLPTLPFGSSDHHLPFGGTLSLTAVTFSAVLDDLLRSLAAAGVRRVVIVNGHGGNHELCGAAAKRAATDHGLTAAAVSYWTLLPAAPGVPGHAGAFETSAMLALDSRCVVMEDAVPAPPAPPSDLHPAVVLEEPEAWTRIDGHTDDPTRASAGAGERSLSEASRELARAITNLAGR